MKNTKKNKNKYRKKSLNKRRMQRKGIVRMRGGDGPAENAVGFIVTRCVKKPEHNVLYNDCYKAIRKFHPDLKIVFIDDNSDKNILEETPMENVEIIQSEYPAAGEFLPYYYLITRKLFKKAIIIQDSIIINTRIQYENVVDFMFFYHSNSSIPQPKFMNELFDATKIPNELKNFINTTSAPKLCWGSIMVIDQNFLQEIEDKMGITNWKNIINNRDYRIGLESAIAGVCTYMRPDKNQYSLFGDIEEKYKKDNQGFGVYVLSSYLKNKNLIDDVIIKIYNER